MGQFGYKLLKFHPGAKAGGLRGLKQKKWFIRTSTSM
jgi:hypothetical protein